MGSNSMRAVRTALLTFGISLAISLLFEVSLALWLSITILMFVILNGILFDIIGTAVTAATEAPFHAMGADKIRGSKEAIYLIRHASQVANFCNDVIGDIAGTVSGAIIASIIFELLKRNITLPHDLVSAAGIAIIAALTVGGKAFGKNFAIDQANRIIFSVGKFLSWLKIIKIDNRRGKRKNKSSTRKTRKNG